MSDGHYNSLMFHSVRISLSNGMRSPFYNRDVYMQIFVRKPTQRHLVLDVRQNDTIHNIKAKIFAKENIPIEQIQLKFGIKLLEDRLSLFDYDIRKEQTLEMGLVAGRRKDTVMDWGNKYVGKIEVGKEIGKIKLNFNN